MGPPFQLPAGPQSARLRPLPPPHRRGRWEVLVELGPGAPLNDLTGTSEEDLWGVGTKASSSTGLEALPRRL